MKQHTPNACGREILAGLTASGGPLNGASVHLFKAGTVVDPTSIANGLPEADYTGYASATASTWGTPHNDGDGAVVEATSVQFNCTGNTTTNSIGGYYLKSSATPSKLLAVVEFDTPVGMTQAGDAIVVVPKFKLPAVQTV